MNHFFTNSLGLNILGCVVILLFLALFIWFIVRIAHLFRKRQCRDCGEKRIDLFFMKTEKGEFVCTKCQKLCPDGCGLMEKVAMMDGEAILRYGILFTSDDIVIAGREAHQCPKCGGIWLNKSAVSILNANLFKVKK